MSEQIRRKRSAPQLADPPHPFAPTQAMRSGGDSVAWPDDAAHFESPAGPPPAAIAPLPLHRVWLVVAFFLVIILTIMVRMSYWAWASSPLPPQASPAAGERVRSRIVDRNGLLLATDNFAWEAYARPGAIAQAAEKNPDLPGKIAQALGQPVETIQAGLAVTYALTTLAKDLTAEQRQGIQALNRPGLVWTDVRRVRAYPQGRLAAHLIGFTNYEHLGLYGVEASYNSWLLGQRDLPAAQITQQPDALPAAWRIYLPSPGRHDLALTMDAALQFLVEQRLAEAIRLHQAQAGTIIVMDPRNGHILALANYPTFDPNDYSRVNPQWWANQAVSESYEPGSVFKLVTMAAALDAGQITPQRTYTDTGVLTIDGQAIRNAENKSYGVVTVQYALAKSINVVTARICLDIGADVFYRYVRQFGFGSLTEVDLSLENTGFLKEPGHSLWSRFDQATNSFGQALLVTPLQMINAVAVIANGGTRYQPQVVSALVQDGQVYRLPPRVLGHPIKPETAKALTRMMVYNVESASYRGFVPGYKVAGKTGTAEISTARGYTTQDTITSFVGFLPAADPQLIILVKLDRPKSSRWAEQVAVPVFGQVAQDAVRVLRIAADEREP